MPTPNLAPLITIPLLGLIAWRRMRRQFGRQPFTPARHIVRLVILTMALAGLVFLAASVPGFALPIGSCIAIGVAAGLINLKLTRFEWGVDGDWYYPHPFIGVALGLLLVGRLVYRSAQVGGLSGSGVQHVPIAQQSPLTYGLLALLVGYYVAYLSGLLLVQARRPKDA